MPVLSCVTRHDNLGIAWLLEIRVAYFVDAGVGAISIRHLRKGYGLFHYPFKTIENKSFKSVLILHWWHTHDILDIL